MPAKPIVGQSVDHDQCSATGGNANGDKRRVGVVKERVHDPPQTYIQEITGRVRLMGGGIKAAQSQGEVNRINVVEVAASESDARCYQCAGKEKQLRNLTNLRNSEQDEDRLSVIQA